MDDPIRARLAQLIAARGTTLAEASRAIGRNHAYLQQFLTRGSPRHLPELVRFDLARFLEVEEGALREPISDRTLAAAPASDLVGTPKPRRIEATENLVGDGASIRIRKPMSAVSGSARGRGDFVSVPVFDIRAAAGHGAFNDAEVQPLHYFAYPSAWLREFTQASAAQLAVIRVAGDSMADTLRHGDLVLIDRSVSRVGRDGIYVLRLDGGELLIKRCLRSARTRLLSIRSDNPLYPGEDDVRDDDVSIEGRACWLGRNLDG